MKTTLLTLLAVIVGLSVSAQKFSMHQSQNVDQNAKLEKKQVLDNAGKYSGVYTPNYSPVSKSAQSSTGVIETLMGGTVYDAQSNGAIQNRIYAYPDGSVGAVWTMGFVGGSTGTGFNDRGTGYNYFDGANWGEIPSARIASETVKNGWPSYSPLGNGEMVVSHTGSPGLYFTSRPAKGTGDWTSSLIPGTAGWTWPRAIAVGNTIHVIVPSSGTVAGLNQALQYIRSTDGGATWEAPRILPGLDAASLGADVTKSFQGFGSDAYAWAEPKNNTIAFVVAESMGGMWIMKSTDNGDTWTKTTACTIPNIDVAPTGILPSIDGSVAIALDNEGNAHVVVGRMRVSDDDFVTAGNSYYPVTDGLLYWKEGMPILDTTQLADWDGLVASGNLIAGMIDYNGNDTIDFPDISSGFPFGLYGVSLSSQAQIMIDDNDNIFVTYSSCREDLVNSGALPNAELYRHLYEMSWLQGATGWSDPIDLTGDIEHSYDECVFASLAPTSVDGNIHVIYHYDSEPGTAVGSDADPVGDVYVNYLTFPTFVNTKPVDITKDVAVSPNPASDFANVMVSLNNSSKVEVNVFDVMGKLVMSENYGVQSSGYHTYKFNTSSLTNGIYLFTVKIGNSQTSKKVIVNN